MMKEISYKIKYVLGLFTLLCVLFVALFGLSLMGMNTSHEKEMAKSMSPCPYAIGESALCTMNVFQHIQAWQNVMRSTPIKNMVSVLMLTSLFLTAVFLIDKVFRRLYEKFIWARIRLYETRRLECSLPLSVSLFSRGILNPKSY